MERHRQPHPLMGSLGDFFLFFLDLLETGRGLAAGEVFPSLKTLMGTVTLSVVGFIGD